MGFGKDAIGFYMQLDDQMSPALKVADRNYESFTKHIDKMNQKVFKSVQSTFGSVAGFFERTSAGSKQFVRSYQQAVAAISKKPARVPVDIVLSTASKKSIGRAIAQGVRDALTGATMRLSAGMPKGRSPLFNMGASLRNQYKAGVQPPDMIGSLNIPKFQQGGVVDGPGGIDKILALLTKGEIVLPADVSKSLQEKAGQAQGAKGFVAFPEELARATAEAENLMKVLPLLQAAMETGLDPKAGEKINLVLARLNENEKKLIPSTAKLSQAYKNKLAPAINDLQKRIKDAGSYAVKTDGFMSKWFKRMLSPLGFLGMHAAVKTLQENFLETRSAIEEVSSATNLDKAADGLVTNFLQMNRVLHLNNAELEAFRNQTLASVEKLPLVVRDIGDITEAMQGLVEAKFSKRVAIEVGQGVALLVKATDLSRESAVELAEVMHRQLGMSARGVNDEFARFSAIAAAANVPLSALAPSLTKAAESGRLFFSQLDPKEAAVAFNSIARISAAAESAVTGAGGEIADIMGAALQDPDKLLALAGALGKTQSELKGILTSGNVAGFFEAIQAQGPMAAKVIGDAFGTSEAVMQLMTTRTEEANLALRRTGEVAVPAGKGLDKLTESAVANMTTFQKLRDSAGNWIANTFPDFIQFLKDLNPLALLSAAYLLKNFGPSLTTVGSILGWVGGKFGWVTKLLQGGFLRVLFMVAPMVTTLVSWMSALVPIIQGAAVAFRVLGAAMFANPIGLIILGITALIGLVYYFREELMIAAKWVGEKLVTAFFWWWDAASPILTAIGSWFSDVFMWAIERAKNAFNQLVSVGRAVYDTFTGIGDAISNWSFDGVLTWIQRLGDSIADFLLAPLNSVLTAVGMDPIKVSFGKNPASDLTAIPARTLPTASQIDAVTASRVGSPADAQVNAEMLAVMEAQLKIMKADQGSAGPTPTTIVQAPRSSLASSVALGGD